MSKRSIIVFLAIVVAATWLIQVLGLRAADSDLSSDVMQPWLLLSMFVPALMAVAFIIFSAKARHTIAWKPGRLIALFMAPLLPTVLAFASIAIVLHFGLGTNGWFEFSHDGVSVIRGPWLLGVGIQSWPLFIANMSITAIVFSVAAGVFTVGEELGWRGLLQPNMIREFGLTRGILLLGFVWGIWHLPVNLAGHNFPNTPVLGAFILMPVWLIAASFFLAALTIWARSFWPAVLVHGANNSIQGSIIGKFEPAVGVLPLSIDLVYIGVACVVGLVSWLLLLMFWRPSTQP